MVRQYTQFMALMNNYDTFKENLDTAYGSEGTLQEQADIYAESWEAARDRVRAAAENIYDSLINADTFIGLDNVVTPVLNRIADVADAMGGLKGVMITLGYAATTLFKDQIAQGLRDAQYNIKQLTGLAAEEDKQFRSLAADMAATMAATTNDAEIQTLAKKVQMENQIYELSKQMDESQVKAATNEKNAVLNLISLGEQLTTTANESQTAINQQVQDIGQLNLTLEKAQTIVTNYYSKSANLSEAATGSQKLAAAYQNVYTQAAQLKSVTAIYKELTENTTEAEQKTEQYQNTLKYLQEQLNNVGLNRVNVSLKDSSQVLNQLSQATVDTERNINNLNSIVNQLAEKLGNDSEVVQQLRASLDALADSTQNYITAQNNAAIVTDEATRKYEGFGATLEGIINRQKDWAARTVSVANQLMSLGMAIQSMKTLVNVFTDKDLTFTERLTQGLAALGMVIPTLVTGYTTLQAANAGLLQSEKLVAAFVELDTMAQSKNVIAKGLGTVATKLLDTASKSLVKTLLLELAIIGTVVAAIYGAVKLVDALTTTQEEAADAISDANSAYDEEKSKLDDLNSSLEETKSRIEEINSQDTISLTDAEELRTLQLEEASLERQIALQERLTAEKQKTQAETFLAQKDKAYKNLTEGRDRTTYGNTKEDAENYLARNQAYLDSVDEDDKKAKQIYKTYEALLNQAEQAQADFVSANQEDYEQLEENYTALLQYYADNPLAYNAEDIASAQDTLKQARMAMVDNDEEEYLEVYVKPVVEQDSLKATTANIYNAIGQGVGYSQYITEDLTNYLEAAGISLEEFEQNAQNTVQGVKEKLIDAFGENGLEGKLRFLSAEDWEILATIDVEGMDSLDEVLNKLSSVKYGSNSISYDYDTASQNASNIQSALSSFAEGDSYEDLDSEQIANLDLIAEKYTQLGDIQDKNSHEYLQALRDIAEQEEANAYKALMNQQEQIEKEGEKLRAKNQTLQSEIQTLEVQAKAAEKEGDTDRAKELRDKKEELEVTLTANTDELDKKIKELEKTKIQIEAQVQLDFDTDISNALGLAKEFESLTDIIQEDWKYTIDEMENLIDQGYGAMFENAKATTDGMIQCDANVANAFIDSQQSKLEASKQEAINELTIEQEKLNAYITELEVMISLYKAYIAAIGTNAEDSAAAQIVQQQSVLANAKQAWIDSVTANDESNSDIDSNSSSLTDSVSDNYIDISNTASSAFSSASNAAGAHAVDAVAAANSVGQAWAAAYEAAEGNGYTDHSAVSQNTVPSSTASKSSSGSSYSGTSGTSSGSTSSGGVQDGRAYGISPTAAGQAAKLNQDKLNQSKLDTANTALSGLESTLSDMKANAGSIAGSIAALQSVSSALDNAQKNATSGSGSGKNGSGSGSGSSKDPDVEDLKTEAGERYHDINRQLEKQADLLDLIDENAERAYGTDRLAYYKQYQEELDDEIDLYNKKLEQAQGYLDSDKKLIAGLGLDVKYDSETNEITNYDEVQEYIKKTYNDFMTSYNAMTADQQDNAKTQLDAMKKWYSNAQDYLGNYEDTLDVIKETTDGIRDDTRKKLDSILTSLNYKLQIKLDAKENLQAYSDFQKTIAESYGDSLTHGLSSMAYAADNARTEAEMSKTFESQASELIDAWNNATTDTNKDEIRSQMNDLLDEIISSGESILDSIEEFENGFADALDAASERFSQFTDTLDHNSAISDTIKEIMTLQGVSLKTAQGFDAIQSTYNSKMQASWAKAKLQKEWLDDLESMLATAEANLAGVDEADASYDMLKNQYDALLTEYQDTQEAMLEATQETMETAQAIFENAVERAAYKLEQALTSNKGFTLLQMQYDNFIDTDERYLDEVNKLYEVTTLTNKIQSSIDESNSKAAAATLQALKDECELRAQNNKLSQYDIDIMNAEYEMTLKQIALEEAQNNKSSLALMRDDQGNWTYKYTADQSEIDSANQDYLDAANNYYNIAKDQVKDVSGEIIDTWQEMTDKIKEVYTDESLTVDEREAQIAEIREYYAQKIKDLEEEKQKAINDMTKAGTTTIQNFDNSYGTALGSMTSSTTTFDEAFNKAIEEMEKASQSYENTITDVNKDTGTSYDDLTKQIDDTTAATEKVEKAGEEATDSMDANLNSIQAQTDHYKELAETLYDVVNAYQQVSGAIVNVTTQDFFDDYSTKMLEAWQDANYSTSSELYSQWADMRMDKGWKDTELSNNEITDLLNQYGKDDAITDYIDKVLDGQAYFTYADRKEYAKFDTGGYTGDFEGGKLALLHQKELVLNAEDTSNILSAVSAVRSLGANVLQSIVEALDSTASAGLGLMAARVNSTSSVSTSGNTLEQQVHIEATFPNVTSSNEIEEALKNLTNEAIQYVNINR